jgi:hypothetical protein
MSQPETIPAPVLDMPKPTENKWQREYRAFLRLLPDLMKTHQNRYVAVHEGRVVASGDCLENVAQDAYARHGYVPIYVGLVTDQPMRQMRFPSPMLRIADGS